MAMDYIRVGNINNLIISEGRVAQRDGNDDTGINDDMSIS